jgi:hypothetical protein
MFFRNPKLFAQKAIRAVIGLALTALIFGWVLKGSVPHASASTPAGFASGVLHGAMMPAALPRLVIGQDIPIYASVNTGHSYKVGYTLGVNICGAVFFGIVYWRISQRLVRGPANVPQRA